jgi:hypothetical protein
MGHTRLLTIPEILAWADAHHEATGLWPAIKTGPVAVAPGETWKRIDAALRGGFRGLPGGSSLARLLSRHRGKTQTGRQNLREDLILAWARDHRRRSGRWPAQTSGPVLAAPGESWRAINNALGEGLRGLPGGDSLSRLLKRAGLRGGKQRTALTSIAPARG